MSILIQTPPFGAIIPGHLADDYISPGTGGGLAAFIRNAVSSLFLVAGLATFAYLLMGGFRYLTAGGDVKATEAAVKIITNAVIGLALIVAAYGLARIIATVFGINIFTPTFVGPT